MLLAATMQVWAEGLVMGEKAGLDWNIMLEVLCNSAVGSPMVTRKAQSLAARSYDKPHLSMHNMAKDLDLALDAAEDLEVQLPTTRQIREVYRAAMADGLEWKDYSAVVLELEKVAGLRPEQG
jgi:3-hydroxyisobutyrate dehydrogenase-like beta-hydroxyacid dehydrogenase